MKNGFTLIELLAVIIILGVLATIAIPKVINNITGAQEVAHDRLLSDLEQLTQLYIRDNKDEITGIKTVGNVVTITINDLVTTQGLKTPVIDPLEEREVDLSTTISILVKPKSKYDVTIGPFIYK
jgi:prepilin-type N-terminal cleavage/methylation domain-containing protein